MRNAFVRGLIDIAEQNTKLVLLMAEVGYGVVEPFEKRFPDRFYNAGISEQSLVLNAAGLAIKGYHPVAYSMSSFLPTRAFEMIKDSVCYQNVPVILVGIGSGISYGELGSTHHAIEEEALMRSLPNMTVIFPSDAGDCIAALKYAVGLQKPVYIGLEKVISKLPEIEREFSPRWEKIGTGRDGAIIACGTMYHTALSTTKGLKQHNMDIAVYRANVVKPLDYGSIDDAVTSRNLFILDEHIAVGGVGEATASYILQRGLGKELNYFEILSIADEFSEKVYSYPDLLDRYGLVEKQIMNRIIEVVKK